ncbi:type II secretion system pilot lipoprotein GspS-beta [Vibrio sp. S9_S30]|uniref:GspS/AspS pilotin family protein n=1 Tax=Vibrio sp. S9_S30 TaxID=2720226 RepID=UPI0016810BCB|nr:GspS/AspS pilotin family protein [Vibrio sp. S9_S30]MBD1556953.1 type II secretion system pilot lipoprotein GspS-beta [Vibrio sp. S9_S30]
MSKYSLAKTIGTALLSVGLFAGCASSDNKQSQIELIAQHRASVLSAGLPVEVGALNIMKAEAKFGVVELLMIYNQDQGKIAPQELMNNAIKYYCSSNEVKAALDQGVRYRLMLRNTRGQLIIDQVVGLEQCNKK